MEFSLIAGSLAYFSLKLIGYSWFAKYLNQLFGKLRSIFIVGVFRTFLDLTLGLFVNFILYSNLHVGMGRSPFGGEDTAEYLLLVVMLRVVEWFSTIFVFYSSKPLNVDRRWLKAIGLGTLFSFVLDVPMMFGLLVVIATIC